MNVIVANKYRDALSSLDIEVIKKLEGEFTVDEIIGTFQNFFFNKMILDVTALKDYKNIKTLQQLSLSLDMDKLILLLDGSPETSDPEYLSDLISMRIYNFTMNVEGVKWLYEHPNSYRDVAQYHQLDTTHTGGYSMPAAAPTGYSDLKQNMVICFKDLTPGAGATTLTYIAKKQLARNYDVVAIEVDKEDFLYLNDKSLKSTTTLDLAFNIANNPDAEVILVDLNDSTQGNLCNEIIYLIEPGLIKLNKLIRKDRAAFEKLKDKKIVLNKSVLTNKDINDFENESNSKVFFNIPYLDDKKEHEPILDDFLVALGFSRLNSSNSGKAKLFNIFK